MTLSQLNTEARRNTRKKEWLLMALSLTNRRGRVRINSLHKLVYSSPAGHVLLKVVYIEYQKCGDTFSDLLTDRIECI